MPSSVNEVQKICNIVDEYIPAENREILFTRLFDEVGAVSENLSFKLSLLMLKTIYKHDTLSLDEKLKQLEQIFASYCGNGDTSPLG